MSKKLFICVLTILLLFTVSCGEAKTLPQDTTCEQLLNAAKQVSTLPQNTAEYVKGQKEFDAYTMSLWADGSYSECAEYELLADYAVFYSSDNTTYEIAVLKAKSQDDTEKLTALFARRQKTLNGSAKAEYDPNFERLMKESKIITEGQFVIFLVTPDNDAIIASIQDLKQ